MAAGEAGTCVFDSRSWPTAHEAAGGHVREERNRRERERTGQRSTEEDRERGEKRGGKEREEEKEANKRGGYIESDKNT